MSNRNTVLLIIFMLTMSASGYAQANKSRELFVKNPAEVYLGALVKKSSINAEKHEVRNNEMDSAWMLSHSMLHMERFAGGKAAYDAALQKMVSEVNLSNFSSSSASFSVQDIVDYQNIDLYFGQTMNKEEVLLTEDEHVSKRTNFVMHAEYIFLDFLLDFVDYGMDQKIALDSLNADDWAYIVSLGYGRKAVVLVETNLDRNIASAAVQEAVNKGSDISAETAKILQHCTIRAATFGTPASTSEHDDTPLMHVYHFLQAPITLKDFETPISFTMIELGGYSTYENEF